MNLCCSGAAETNWSRRPADDTGQSEKGGRDETLCRAQQGEFIRNNILNILGFDYRCSHWLGALNFQASAKKEIEESMQVFSELVRSIQRAQAELVLVIEEKQRQTESWAQGLIAELEQEISELKRRNSELENVARTDHINFLKVTENCFRGQSRSLSQDTCRLCFTVFAAGSLKLTNVCRFMILF